MSGERSPRLALWLVLLMVSSTWMASLSHPVQSPLLGDDHGVQRASQGDITNLTLSGTPNTQMTLDLPAEQPVYDAELRFTPKVLPSQSGFSWNSAADWTHSDAIMNGTTVSNDALTGTSEGNLWDFNTNNQGWTFSNSFSGRVTSPACGFNGSSGGSLRTYAGSTYATSPTVNLAGGQNIPFHAWVRQGSFNCGEEPDTGEDLQFQYRTAAGGWTMFQSYAGSTSGGTIAQFQTTLPSAALHANSQFRIHQTSGSSTCCDYWFVDDVHIATPPDSNWTSPSMGHASGVTVPLADDTYMPLTIDATIPSGAWLNWSVLDAQGSPIPGMTGSNVLSVPLHLLNHSQHDEIRLMLEFKGGEDGMTTVHSISGDGTAHESFISNPLPRGWLLNGSTHRALYEPVPDTTGCGIDPSLAGIEAYANYPVYNLTQTFTASVVLKCNPQGLPLRWTWNITDGSGVEVDNGVVPLNVVDFSSAFVLRSLSSNELHQDTPSNYTLRTVYEVFDTSVGDYAATAWSNSTFASARVIDATTDTTSSQTINPRGAEHRTSACSVHAHTEATVVSTGEEFTGTVATFCPVLNESMQVDWEVLNTTNSVVDSGTFVWVNQAYNRSQTVVSTAMANEPEGAYSLRADFSFYNGLTSRWSVLDNDGTDFAVTNLSSAMVNSSACEVRALVDTDVVELNTAFTGRVESTCALTNTTLRANYTLRAAGASTTVGQGSSNWTNIAFLNTINWSVPALASQGAGTYTYGVELSSYNNSTMNWTVINTDSATFSVTNFTVIDLAPSLCRVEALPEVPMFDVGEAFDGWLNTACSPTRDNLSLAWAVMDLDSNTMVDSGTINWTNTQFMEVHPLTASALATEAPGNYTFEVNLSWFNTTANAWTQLDNDSRAFAVVDASGSSLDDQPCLVHAQPLKALMVTGGTFEGQIHTTCAANNATMWATWSLENTASQTVLDSGSFEWTQDASFTTLNVTSTSTNTQGSLNLAFTVDLTYYNTTPTPVWNWVGIGSPPLNQPVDCGVNPGLTNAAIFTNQDHYARSELVNLVLRASCLPTGTDVRATWSIVDEFNTTLHNGQSTWNQSSTMGQLSVNGLSLSNAQPVVHTVTLDLDLWNASSSQWEPLDGSRTHFTAEAEHAIIGGATDVATSPWFLAGAAAYDIDVHGTTTQTQIQVRHHPAQPWSTITLPYDPVVDQEAVGVQLRFSALPPSDGNMSNFTAWSLEELEIGLYGGQVPARPGLDFNLDDRFEWGHEDVRVGSWGSQDRFANGQEHMALSVSSASPSTGRAWVPAEGLTSLSFGFHSESGFVRDVAIFVQNTFITNRTFNANTIGTVTLTPSELLELRDVLQTIGPTVEVMGTNFTELRIEVSGQGTVVLAGLRASYLAGTSLLADGDSPFVLGLNEARSTIPVVGGTQSVPLPFVSEGRGGLTVEVVRLQSSSALRLISGGMVTPPDVLTPSAEEQTVRTRYSTLGSTITFHRLDVYSAQHHAVYMFPASGGTPVVQGDHELVTITGVELADTSTTSGANISFRLRPQWDDEMRLTVTSRAVMANGVAGIPFTHTWGSTTVQGYENDLELKSMQFSDAEGPFDSTRQYIRGGEEMNVSIRVGFEGLNTMEAFVSGDAQLSLFRDDIQLSNTTTLDGVYWNVTVAIPFTYGDVTWDVRLTSLNGSGVIEPSEFSRVFTVDSVRPRVLESTMALYDHRTPSPTQVAQVTVMDQPVLPSAMDAMVWKEWQDDANLNGWPDPGEYNAVAMLVPSDQTQLTGVYTLMLDDTGGELGDKVSVYLSGTDPSGYAIQNGGSDQPEDQLFTYQLAIDGAPSLASDAFRWSDGRHSWLHPAEPYRLNLAIEEPNGGSDLSTVEVMLANNQGSDPMSIEWDFSTKACTTESLHVVIEGCVMRGANGPAGPFEPSMVLELDFQLGWNTPDLGENRREPAIRVVDRAGQEAFRAFPEHRWRFSAGLSIPDESVSLFLSSGSFLGDGARVTPSTSMEVSGGVVFAETMTVPSFDCEVNVLLAGRTYTATTIEGIWSMGVTAPPASGSYPLTWSIGCLEGQGQDLTDAESSVRWILVDGTGPQPIEVLSPRAQATLTGESYEVRVVMNELGGLDMQSMELIWEVEDFATGDIIRTGREPVTLTGEEVAGLRLELTGEMNLSSISRDMLVERMVVNLRIEGRDLAGNAVQGGSGDDIITWNMEWLQPEFTVSPSALTYSRLLLDLGESTSVQVEVENIGSLEGSVDVVFEEVTPDGMRSVIQRTTASAPASGVTTVTIDWSPEAIGLRWVEATLATGGTTSGPTVDVRSPIEPSLTEQVFGDVNPVIGSIAMLLFVAVLGVLLVYMRRMTINQGAKEEMDWDDYSSDLEDDDGEEESQPSAATSTSSVVSTSSTKDAATGTDQSSNATSDWVKGSDGYWWYHDKASGEWWYKDANGDIVKHP